MVPSGVTCPDVEKLPHQALDAREIGLLVHPVVVEVSVAGLGRAKGHRDEPVARAFRQVQERPTAVGVPAVGKAVAGAVRLEGLAGRAPQLLAPLDRVPGGDLLLGVLEELECQGGMLFSDCLAFRIAPQM